MNYFLKNKVIFGDSCSGKTFIFKKIKIKKLDIDYFLLYKKILFKNEFFFRKMEQIMFLIFKNIKIILLIGGGSFQKFNIYYLIYKNNSIINQKKRLFLDNFNRPTLKKNFFLKIRFCIRKKTYIKISNYYFNKCYKCNIFNL
ncbi:hypothetical protein ACJEC8_01155 [Candidatus Carsonella ruddii]|uniref:hypothetical protein n=1 Tax=Carsonella ruddii TaxID=114186 RepID=UPI003D9A9BE1